MPNQESPLVFLFTDFGTSGPYMGQMEASLAKVAPSVRVITLQADAPRSNPRAAGYLLAALLGSVPVDATVVAVVDPGVGTERRALAARADGRWLVGPDNGLLAPALAQAGDRAAWQVDWRPERLSASFHGRDLFAPVAGRLATGGPLPGPPVDPARLVGCDWPGDLAQIVYIDHFGNAMTGIRAVSVDPAVAVECAGHRLQGAGVFGAVSPGEAFWYENSCGLLELAVNLGSAAEVLGLQVGDAVTLT